MLGELGVAVIVNVNAAVLVSPPPVAEIVKGYEPVFTVLAAVSVRVLLPPAAAMLVGAKLLVIPVGIPVTVSESAELNPLDGVAVTAN